MKTKILIVFLLYAGSSFIAKGQKISSQVINNYNSSVVAKVYDIVSQIPLSENRQLKLATIIQNGDSIISTAIKKGAEKSEIDLIRAKTEMLLANFFKNSEVEKYYFSKYQSQFNDVLLLKNIVRVRNPQIDSLVRLDREMQNMFASNVIFDPGVFERKSLSRILTSDQYNNYLAIRTRRAALVSAAKDWDEMIKFNIAPPKDSTKLFKYLVKYNIARSSAIDRYQDNRKVRNEHLREIEKTMNPMQSELERARKIQKKAASDSTQYGQRYNGSFQW